MNTTTCFTHDYSPRDHKIVEYGFYELPSLPGFRLRGPAVDIEQREDYFTCIGAAQTLGVYVPTPYPNLLSYELGIPAWNLGVGGASPYFFLQHPELFPYINKGRFAILQVMTARDEPNDRIEPSPTASLVTDKKYGDTVVAQIVWQRILTEEPEKLAHYIAQSRANWETHMRQLMDLIQVPTIHFWFSPKQLHTTIDPTQTRVAGIIDNYPQFINGENISYLSDSSDLITCFSDRNETFPLLDRYTGKPTEVDYAILDHSGKTPSFMESVNVYYPSQEMQWDAALKLTQTIRARGLHA